MGNFEGPEKKLEIILRDKTPGFRENRNARWTEVVRASGAAIINCISTEALDAYLLSESSLLVWDDRMSLITCGQTTPAWAVEKILGTIDIDQIGFVFYERKNALFPEEQPTNFDQDLEHLRNFFQGDTIRLGAADDDHVDIFYASLSDQPPAPTCTLQILMHGLDPSVAALFTNSASLTPACENRLSRLDRLCRCRHKNSHFFYPQGYSVNALAASRYYTVHVTPQPEGSYTSFESNAVCQDCGPLIEAVVSIFKPARFAALLTSTTDRHGLSLHATVKGNPRPYRLTETVCHKFDPNHLTTYTRYARSGYT